jgi:hypothetical protein
MKERNEISLDIDLFFEDSVAGVIIPPVALPIQCQTSIPVILFGLTDYYGAYVKSALLNPPVPPWVAKIFMFSADPPKGIWGYNSGATGLPPLTALCQNGDMILIYNFPVPPTMFTALVRIRCQAINYGTLLNSFVSDLITINSLKYVVPLANINQFNNPIIISKQSLFGRTKSDNIDPRMFLTNKAFQPQIAEIPLRMELDKENMINFQMDVFCPNICMTFFVEKIDSLIHNN